MKVFFNKIKRTNKIFLAIYIVVFISYLISLIFLTRSLLLLTSIETVIRIIALILFYLLGFTYILAGVILLFLKRNKTFLILSLILALLSPLYLLGSHYINSIYTEIDQMSKEKVKYVTNLIALKGTTINNESKLGMINDAEDLEGNILAKKLINQENLKDSEIIDYEDYYEMLIALSNKEVDGIFVPSNFISMFTGIDTLEAIINEIYIVYSYSEERENEDLRLGTNKNLTEPFTMLIMGIDSNSTTLASNGDTLMMITFNPKTLSATVFSIPRDLYVPIACRNNEYSKINSSTGSGTSCAINTIEQLTDVEIDYYLKINFKGVVNLVDALGGITINVGKAFCEQNSNRQFGDAEICLDEGVQEVNGEEALAFIRHRHTLIRGDIDRIQNQQQVVEQIAKKAKTIRNFEAFKEILNTLQKNMDTNLTTDKILSMYNIGKDIFMNSKNPDEFIAIEKTYLEYYSLPVYIPRIGAYTSALGYYKSSLDEITRAMKVNLELEKRTLVKTFSYSFDESYEIRPLGKGLKEGNILETMPSFVGKTKSAIESWCNARGISVIYQNVNEGDDLYNPFYPTGYVVSQSIHQGVLSLGYSKITIYVINNTSGNDTTVPDEDNEECDPNIDITCNPLVSPEDEEE